VNKKVFKEPIIRAKINKIRFPNCCPVCGAPATSTTWISTAPRKKRLLRPHWDPAYSPTSRRVHGISAPHLKSFPVPVCEGHHVSDDGVIRFRSIAALILVIVASSSIFVIMFAGSDYWYHRGLSSWLGPYFLVLAASVLVGVIAFKPNGLESSVKIVGFDFDVQYVWLNLKREEYRRKFMNENEMNAELVTWIVKV
jgi:hypothetical protein